MKFKIIIIFSLISGLILPSFSFAQEGEESKLSSSPFATAQEGEESKLSSSPFATAREQEFKQPETVEEVKALGEKALEVGKKELPGVLGTIWKEEILPIWQKMYNWFKINVWPKIESWFKKEVEPRAKEEIEKRKPAIEEEFQKEKEELKEELPKVGKSLWEKFKELIK